MARESLDAAICALARCNREDIELAARAVQDAPRRRLHVFLATSAIHREYKLNMAQEEILCRATEGIRFAKEFCDDVVFFLPRTRHALSWSFSPKLLRQP